jgi:hypothetical protein
MAGNRETRRRFCVQAGGAGLGLGSEQGARAPDVRLGTRRPNVANSGVRFARNYSQFPLCNPSRSSLLTGRHPATKENGYHTVRLGKIFHGGIDDPKAWSEGGGAREGDGGAGGHTLAVRLGAVPPPPGEPAPQLPPERSQGAHSDRIMVLDGTLATVRAQLSPLVRAHAAGLGKARV